MNAIYLHRIGRWFYLHRIPVIPGLVYALIYLMYNSSIPMSAEIGRGSRFSYGGIGVVVHARCKLGRNVIIGQNTTLGGRSGQYRVPTVGDDVYILVQARES